MAASSAMIATLPIATQKRYNLPSTRMLHAVCKRSTAVPGQHVLGVSAVGEVVARPAARASRGARVQVQPLYLILSAFCHCMHAALTMQRSNACRPCLTAIEHEMLPNSMCRYCRHVHLRQSLRQPLRLLQRSLSGALT